MGLLPLVGVLSLACVLIAIRILETVVIIIIVMLLILLVPVYFLSIVVVALGWIEILRMADLLLGRKLRCLLGIKPRLLLGRLLLRLRHVLLGSFLLISLAHFQLFN